MRAPKKLRGDAAALARTQKEARKIVEIAREATKAALDGEAHRRTLNGVIAILVGRLGGEVTIPFREIATMPPLGMRVDGQGTPDQAVTYRVGVAAQSPAETVILGDQVIVTAWAADPRAESPELTELHWTGVVEAIDEGALLLVRLSPEWAAACERETVLVRRAWCVRIVPEYVSTRSRREVDDHPDDHQDLVAEPVSTRVDTFAEKLLRESAATDGGKPSEPSPEDDLDFAIDEPKNLEPF